MQKKFTSIHRITTSEKRIAPAKEYLSGTPNLVRAILFNKTLQNNWLVSWHQDKTIAVSDKLELAGWVPWSSKDNIHHVQPPIDILNDMITFRIHLDDTNKDNECLKVLPRSHLLGILDQPSLIKYLEDNMEVNYFASAATALVMRPHILHSSSKTTKPNQKRILDLEYSSYELPNGVYWA
jgi:ectoine hydroxylase-related dioxygenase (phytanoyl-CoA dioxygenase family)